MNDVKECPKCKVELLPGKALVSTFVAGVPDFIGQDPDPRAQTFYEGGPGRLVDCLKCPECGYSISQ